MIGKWKNDLRLVKRGAEVGRKRGQGMLVSILAVIGGIVVLIGIVWTLLQFIRPVKYKGYDGETFVPEDEEGEKPVEGLD